MVHFVDVDGLSDPAYAQLTYLWIDFIDFSTLMFVMKRQNQAKLSFDSCLVKVVSIVVRISSD